MPLRFERQIAWRDETLTITVGWKRFRPSGPAVVIGDENAGALRAAITLFPTPGTGCRGWMASEEVIERLNRAVTHDPTQPEHRRDETGREKEQWRHTRESSEAIDTKGGRAKMRGVKSRMIG
jgi:hypothetical protein